MESPGSKKKNNILPESRYKLYKLQCGTGLFFVVIFVQPPPLHNTILHHNLSPQKMKKYMLIWSYIYVILFGRLRMSMALSATTISLEIRLIWKA